MLSRKDYEAIARIISSLTDKDGWIDRCDLVERLSELFEEDNLSFDRRRFEKACQEGGK